MGASNFCDTGKGKTAQEAFGRACDQAGYEHGHGYSGSLAEKYEFITFPLPELPDDMTPCEFAEMATWHEPTTYGGRHYWTFEDGKSVEHKIPPKPIPPALIEQLRSIGEAVDNKWGPAGCIEVPGSVDSNGDKTFVFFGWASS